MPGKKETVAAKALEILRKHPQGMRHAELRQAVIQACPGMNANTIQATIHELETRSPAGAYKPARGVYRHTDFRDDGASSSAAAGSEVVPELREEDFYEAFASYLVQDLEDCTKAIALGGNKFRDKWGTPDVIGVWRSRPSDVIKASDEIVTAEIKLDSSALITAFGQACSYKLFSHKAYLVVPKGSPEEDVKRLESLCTIFGIGLILFRADNVEDPAFEIRVSPAKHEPDMFYVNRNLKLVEEELLS